jgi:hypothetical protein
LKKNNKQQFEATDLGNTERFISEHRGRLLSVSSANQWLKWNGRRSSERTEASADRERTAATSRVGSDAREVDPEQRIMRSVATRVSEPCLVLWLRSLSDRRRNGLQDTDHSGEAQPGMSDAQCEAKTEIDKCD